MNNYILARWRDAIGDPPGDGWSGQYRYNDGETVSMGHGLHHGGSWWTELENQESRTPEPGDQWLDITDRPAVAREAVQAAVDEICGDPVDRCGCLLGDCIDCANDTGCDYSADIVTNHTGVTPTEVK